MEFTEKMIGEGKYVFAESPIVVGVKMGASDFPSGCTSRKCEINVTVGSNVSTFETMTYNSDEVVMDVRSALGKAMYLRYNALDPSGMAASSTENVIDVAVSVKGKYIAKNGEQFTEVGNAITRNFKCIPGGLDARTRFEKGKSVADDIIKTLDVLSMRGSGQIVVGVGDSVITSRLNYGEGKINTTKVVVSNGGNIFVEDNGDRREIFFINSYGMLESVSAVCLENLSVPLSADSYELIEQPKFLPEPRMTSKATLESDRMEMSSGYVDVEGAEFWMREVLKSRRWWMRIGGQIVPVTVEAKSSDGEIYDRKGEVTLPCVDFKVKMGV